MGRETKAINRPKCGSVDKKNLKEDRFLCSSCNTEYYLDNDYRQIAHHNEDCDSSKDNSSININIKIKKEKKKKKKNQSRKIIPAIIFFLLIRACFNAMSTEEIVSSDLFAFKTKNELYYVLVGIEKEGDDTNKIVAYFYDHNATQIKKQELKYKLDKNHNWTQKHMMNGVVYLIYNDKRVFKINTDNIELQEVKEVFLNYPELASGIMKVDCLYSEDGLRLTTQEGKAYSYFPSINKLISANKIYKFCENPPNAVVKKHFKLVNSEDEKNVKKIITYTVKEQIGYASQANRFDYETISRSRNESIAYHQSKGILSYRLLTDRNFFHTFVLGYDDDILIIRTTASENESTNIQALSTRNGSVLGAFDLSISEKNLSFNHSGRAIFSDKYIAITCRNDFGTHLS